MNIQNWFIFLGLLIISGLVLDAIRRIIKQRRPAMSMPFDLETKTHTAHSEWNELPHGGARVKQKTPIPSDKHEVSENFLKGMQETNDLSDEAARAIEVTLSKKKLSHINEWDDQEQLEQAFEYKRAAFQKAWFSNQNMNLTQQASNLQKESLKQHSNHVKDSTANLTVFTMHLVNKELAGFPGQQVLSAMLSCGLELTSTQGFVYNAVETGRPIFQIVNGVEPGLFNQDTMSHKTFPLLTCLMTLPGPKEPVQAFEIMVSCIDKLSHCLNAVVYDDKHQLMTIELFKQYRQQVLKYQKPLYVSH